VVNKMFVERYLRNTFQRSYITMFTILALFCLALDFGLAFKSFLVSGQGGSMSSATNGTNVTAIHDNATERMNRSGTGNLTK
jgi:hypothetical protein